MKFRILMIYICFCLSVQANAQTHSTHLENYISIFNETNSIFANKSPFENCYLLDSNCGETVSSKLETYIDALQSFKEMYQISLTDYELALGKDLYQAQRISKEHFPLIFDVKWAGKSAAENESRIIDMMIRDAEILLKNIIQIENNLKPYAQNPLQYNQIILKSRSRLLPGRHLADFMNRLTKNLPRTIEELRNLNL